LLKWRWLDEYTFYKTFDIDAVISYMLRLEMLEKWCALDAIRGAQTFRQLVSEMRSVKFD